MWKSHYETTTDVPASDLFEVIADIAHWPQWDEEIESIQMDGAANAGQAFVLKPKGGPNVPMSVEEIRSPHLLTDIASLPGAKMRTIHELVTTGNHTTIRFTLEIWGPLGFFWRKMVGEKQIEGAGAQVAALIRYARTQTKTANA